MLGRLGMTGAQAVALSATASVKDMLDVRMICRCFNTRKTTVFTNHEQ